MSWSYQMGRKLKVPATQIAFVALTGGFFFFLGYLYYNHRVNGLPPGNPWMAPWPVWIFTMVGGVGQVMTVALIDPAQKRGPSAPVFCAMNLLFLPASLYAMGVLKETITPLQGLGLVTAIGCVAVAGKAQSVSASEGPVLRSRLNVLIYPLYLLGLMVSSSLATIVMKQLQAMPYENGTLFTYYQGLYLCLTYACGVGGLALILTRSGWSTFQTKRAIGLGSFAAVGSISGFLTFCRISALPGGVGFALANIVCFVTIALISAFLFQEKRNWAWYLTLLLAVIGVSLFALGMNR
jgi:drug/metabolite transporter (DMT)-like permease